MSNKESCNIVVDIRTSKINFFYAKRVCVLIATKETFLLGCTWSTKYTPTFFPLLKLYVSYSIYCIVQFNKQSSRPSLFTTRQLLSYHLIYFNTYTLMSPFLSLFYYIVLYHYCTTILSFEIELQFPGKKMNFLQQAFIRIF